MNGYLASTNTSLPASEEDLNCSQLYQQTEVLINPLDYKNELNSKELDVFNLKYILGEEKCTQFSTAKNFCNRPLRSGERYGLMARIFTKDAFRDTQPVYFETKMETPILLTAPIVIASGAILSLILISTLIASICWWNIKRERKLKKKKAAAETDENLLSFTSYCVIDKNPVSRNQFDHLL